MTDLDPTAIEAVDWLLIIIIAGFCAVVAHLAVSE